MSRVEGVAPETAVEFRKYRAATHSVIRLR